MSTDKAARGVESGPVAGRAKVQGRNMAMNELVEGSKLFYALSPREADDINAQIAKYPDRQPPGTHMEAGQRVPATVVRSRGPKGAGEERLAVLLDGTTPPDKGYHVWADDLVYADGAWGQPT